MNFNFSVFGGKKPQLKKRRRMYAAAQYNRLTAGWITSSSSQDAETKGSLRPMRDRSRQLGRDNDYIKGFFREVRNNIVGEGIKFDPQVKKKRGALDQITNDLIKHKWKVWTDKSSCHTAGQLHFQDIERLVIGATAQDGEIFVRMIRQPFGGSKIPFSLEIIEADQLDELELTLAPNGNEIRMGVEIDKWMRPVAYWFRKRHPGDYPFINAGAQDGERIRVPAEEIIPLGIIERPVQTRSIPWLHSAMLRLNQMSGYEEAELVAARASASLMGFIQNEEGEMPDDNNATEGDDPNRERVTDFEPGVFKYLAPGEQIVVPDLHRPGGQFEPFMRIMLRAVAMAVGVSYATLSRDYSQSNFSSSRMDILSERDNWRILQKWMIRNFHQVVYRNWLDMAVLAGELDLPDFELNTAKYHSVKWMPRGWAWIDPVKEVAASKEAILGGLSTLTSELARQGQDIEEMFAQRQREIELAKAHNLVLDTDFANDLKKAPKAGPQAADAPEDGAKAD